VGSLLRHYKSAIQKCGSEDPPLQRTKVRRTGLTTRHYKSGGGPDPGKLGRSMLRPYNEEVAGLEFAIEGIA
jgi:hypothetical protein